MITIGFKAVAAGLLLVFAISTGIWLSNSEKPLNTLIFTIHKLIALLAVIFTGMVIHSMCRNIEINAIIITLIIVMGLCFLILFITGAFLSFEKPLPGIVLVLHRIVTILIIISTITLIYKK